MTGFLKIGEPINGHTLEMITSGWPPVGFVTMCNSLLFAITGMKVDSIPNFTERINAKDRGIDGEWDIDIDESNAELPSPLVTKGWNVFQYKQRDMLTNDRTSIIRTLKSKIKGDIKKLIDRTGRKPDNYVMFLNIDKLTNQQKALTDALLEGLTEDEKPRIQIAGAAELAAQLNSVPHIRSIYFVPGSFKTWDKAFEDHLKSTQWSHTTELIGRENELERLKALIDNDKIHTIIITGTHSIGKTRIALEASRIRKNDVAVTVDSQSRKIEDYIALCSAKKRTLCIVDEPPLHMLRQMIDEAMVTDRIQFIATLSNTKNSSFQINCEDPRVQLIDLQPLDGNDCWKLLDKSEIAMALSIKEWIYSQSQGNPGVLLAAASAAKSLRTGSDFFASMGRYFEERLRNEFGEGTVETARIISMLSNTGISGRFENEIKTLCELLGGVALNAALNNLDNLERTGIVERKGSFASIKLTFLANYLASQAVRGRKAILFALFDRLESSAKLRLLERLCQIKGEEVEEFWDEFFGANGPMKNLQSALAFSDILHILTSSQPDRVLRIIEIELKDYTLEERLELKDNQRRAIVNALEQLLSRKKTSLKALNLIALLAEAENEQYMTNATGLFSSAFNAFQLQIPLTVYEKLDTFINLTSQEKSKKIRLLTIEASRKSLERGFFLIRHSFGAEPLDSMPDCTYDEILEYVENLIDRLIELADDADDDISRKAIENILELNSRRIPGEKISLVAKRFRDVAGWMKNNAHRLMSIDSFIKALRNVTFKIALEIEKPYLSEEKQEEYRGYLNEFAGIKDRLEAESFIVRFKRILGVWNTSDYEIDNETGKNKSQIEVEELIKEISRRQELLDNSMIAWLLSPEGNKSRVFFYSLGKLDIDRRFLQLVEGFTRRAEAQEAFSSYLGGWADIAVDDAEVFLFKLYDAGAISTTLFVYTAAWFKPVKSIFLKVIELVTKEPQIRNFLDQTLSPNWLLHMTSDQYLVYLKTIAGEQKEYISDALHSMHYWIYHNRPMEPSIADFAWECIEGKPVIKSRNDYWCIDYIASILAELDIERGFAFLESSADEFKPGSEGWNPIDIQFESDQLWNMLYRKDSRRLLELIVTSSKKSDTLAFCLSWKVKRLFNYGEDRELLISTITKDIESARIIAQMLNSEKEKFWPLVFEILRLYHNDSVVRKNLFSALEMNGEFINSSYKEKLLTTEKELSERLKDPSTPTYSRSWLQEALTRIDKFTDEFPVWEYDMDQKEFRRHIEDKGSSLHEWAVGRVLKYSDWREVRTLLTINDIAEVLPKVDLPDTKKRTIERALQAWSYDV